MYIRIVRCVKILDYSFIGYEMIYMNIPALIRAETSKIIESSYKFGAFSPWHINTGWCYELSRSVSDALTEAGIENEILDSDWIIKHGPNEGRPKGVGRLGYHEFVFTGGRYYDSETPEGVESPYDLPIVQAAIVSRQTNKTMLAYLDDPNAVEEFQCPTAIRDAFVRNLDVFANGTFPVEENINKAVHVAAEMLWEPVYSHMKHDELRMTEAFSRIMNSFGISSVVETGEAAPEFEIAGVHHWLRFADGTIFDVAFEKSNQFDKSTLGGKVRIIHASDELNERYRPDTSFAFNM